MFGTTEGYLRAFAPKVGVTPSTLATKPRPHIFEELYGKDAWGLLEDVIDDPDNYDADERELALRLLSGHKLADLGADDRARLGSIARGLAGVSKRRHEPARSVPEAREERTQDQDEEGPTGQPDSSYNRAFPSMMNNDDAP